MNASRWMVVIATIALIAGCAAQVPPSRPIVSIPTGTTTRQPILSGRVVDESGRPIANCDVTVGTTSLGENLWWAQSEMLKSQTDARGRFSVRLPFSGLLYGVFAEKGIENSEWQEMVVDGDRDIELRLPITVSAATNPAPPTSDSDFDLMQCRGETPEEHQWDFSQAVVVAHIRGIVVDTSDKPISGALACTLVTQDGDYRNQYRWATTDANGKFDLMTGHVGESLTLEVGHGQFGVSGPIAVGPLKAGETSSELRIVLPGTIHVDGTVRDQAGRPIPDVACLPSWMNNVAVRTDAAGEFNFGLLSMPTSVETSSIAARPPTLGNGMYVLYSDNDAEVIAQGEAANRTFYLRADKPLTAKAGQVMNLPIQLRTDELLTIHGQVMDIAGHPLTGATVSIFGGTPDDRWFDSTVSQMLSGISPRHAASDNDSDCADGGVDSHSRFIDYVLRSEGEETANGTRYAIGISSASKPRKLVKDVILVDKRELEVKIRVDPAVALATPSDAHIERSAPTVRQPLRAP